LRQTYQRSEDIVAVSCVGRLESTADGPEGCVEADRKRCIDLDRAEPDVVVRRDVDRPATGDDGALEVEASGELSGMRQDHVRREAPPR